MKLVVQHAGDAGRSAHQELRAPLRVCVHVCVQLSQLLVDAVQLSLHTFILLVAMVKFSFVVQTLFLIQDGRKGSVDDTSVNWLIYLASKPAECLLKL